MTNSSKQAPISVDPGKLRLDDPKGSVGTLVGTRCVDCELYAFGQAMFCQACSSSRLEPVDLSREGTLYSYTIVRVPPDGWPGAVPYVLGEVELEEGPHILAEIIEVAHDDLRVGLKVQLAFQEVTSGDSGRTLVVYKWAPAGDSTETLGEV